MKNSKEAIFRALRESGAEKFDMPDLSGLENEAMKFDNPLETFCASVKAAGGQVVEAADYKQDAEENLFYVDGKFGVAENGAVWISGLPDGAGRVDLFIHEKLVIGLLKDNIVNNMHEAYLRLGESADGYGIFISGPSKTADIEQALVFGAHGPRALTVILK